MTKRRYPTRAAPVLRFFQFPIRQTIFALALAPTLAVAFCQLPAAAQCSAAQSAAAGSSYRNRREQLAVACRLRLMSRHLKKLHGTRFTQSEQQLQQSNNSNTESERGDFGAARVY